MFRRRSPESGGSPEQREKLKKFFLARLARFATFCKDPEKIENPEWRLVARYATLSAYRDCAGIGFESEARDVLRNILGEKAFGI